MTWKKCMQGRHQKDNKNWLRGQLGQIEIYRETRKTQSDFWEYRYISPSLTEIPICRAGQPEK